MKILSLSSFKGGWVVGNFEPSLLKSENFEVAIKHYAEGDTEKLHYQMSATEITILISGSCRLGQEVLAPGQVAVIYPLEAADFEALTDCILVAIKTPSNPQDKVIGHP
jgi:hypothetical protein